MHIEPKRIVCSRLPAGCASADLLLLLLMLSLSLLLSCPRRLRDQTRKAPISDETALLLLLSFSQATRAVVSFAPRRCLPDLCQHVLEVFRLSCFLLTVWFSPLGMVGNTCLCAWGTSVYVVLALDVITTLEHGLLRAAFGFVIRASYLHLYFLRSYFVCPPSCHMTTSSSLPLFACASHMHLSTCRPCPTPHSSHPTRTRLFRNATGYKANAFAETIISEGPRGLPSRLSLYFSLVSSAISIDSVPYPTSHVSPHPASSFSFSPLASYGAVDSFTYALSPFPPSHPYCCQHHSRDKKRIKPSVDDDPQRPSPALDGIHSFRVLARGRSRASLAQEQGRGFLCRGGKGHHRGRRHSRAGGFGKGKVQVCPPPPPSRVSCKDYTWHERS